MTTVYVVSEKFRDPWQAPSEEPNRARVVAIYSDESSARTHVSTMSRAVGRILCIESFEVDGPLEACR